MIIIPKNYADWERCITVDCGIPLTPDYIDQRIQSLQNDDDYHTQKFVKTWGEAHRVQTLVWFQEAATKIGTQQSSTGEL